MHYPGDRRELASVESSAQPDSIKCSRDKRTSTSVLDAPKPGEKLPPDQRRWIFGCGCVIVNGHFALRLPLAGVLRDISNYISVSG